MFQDAYTIWLREIIRFTRAKSRIISSLAMPVVWLAFVGVGFSSSFQMPGTNYINFLAPGIIGMIILFTSIFSGVSVIWDRQFGFLKEILVAPVSRTCIMLGKTLGGATVAVISAFIMLAIALATGLVPLGFGILTALVFMILTSVCFVSLGLLIASRMRSMEGFQMIMSFFIMPVFFLSGAIFPLNNTPVWMHSMAMANPLTYGVDGLRVSLLGSGMFPLAADASILAGFAMFFVLLGSYMFRKSSI